MAAKCKKAEPGNSVNAQGGPKGVTHKSKCKNCEQPVERHFGGDKAHKGAGAWHHAVD